MDKLRRMKMETMRRGLWGAFLGWTAVQLIVLPFDLGAAEISMHIISAAAQKALLAMAKISDVVWIVLAAAFVYFHLIQQEGLRQARRIAGVIVMFILLLEIVGLKTGFPFGPHIYTGQLGKRIAGVPFAMPLLWLVIVCCSRYVVLHFLAHARRWQIALGTGLLTVLTDLSFEQVAWKIRGIRLWWFPAANTPDWPPLQNYVCWFFAGAALAWLTFPTARPVGKQWRPLIMLALFNLVFLVTILARRG